MRFLIVRTDIRAAAADDLAAALASGRRIRDERTSPEPRRQTARADDRDAALVLARALASVGAVRSGRQRVKVVAIGDPEPAPLNPAATRPHSAPASAWPDRTPAERSG